jgi:hypothetical protein
MNTPHRSIACLAGALALAAGPNPAGAQAPPGALTAGQVTGLRSQAGQTQVDAMDLQLALLAFQNNYRRWPTNTAELQTFTRQTRRPLDLSHFTQVQLQPVSAQTMLVQYSVLAPRPASGTFAVSVRISPPR